MDNIVRSMMIDLIAAINSPGLIENIIARDKEVNKLNFMISKILKAAQNDKNIANALNISEQDILKQWEINSSIEKIGDRIKHMARYLPEVKSPTRKTLTKLFQDILEFYKNSMKAFYNNSIEEADEISEAKAEIGKEITDFATHNDLATAKITINAFNVNGHINDINRIVRYISNDA
jgi:phosphate uptake regulator